MSLKQTKFTITIPTKNRLSELKYTLKKIEYLIKREDVTCLICDDGSTDNTFEYISQNYPEIIIIRNNESKGIHFTRNRLLNKVTSPYILSIDDDAHFITENVLEIVEDYFKNNSEVALLSFRAFWNKEAPSSIITCQRQKRVQNFGAVGFALRTEAWNSIPNFLDWFVFYGEENYAAFHLFKKGWQIHYIPEDLVHHRVNLKERKNDSDYQLRLRRSLRSGWYLYILFYPWNTIPKLFLYTLYQQIKLKVFKGDLKAFLALMQAICDVVYNFPRLLKNSNRFSEEELDTYKNISGPELYWSPENG